MTDAAPIHVHYDVDGGVCTLTLDSPGRRNAWNPAMEQQYFAALDRAAADGEVRAIVLTGAGDSFCPGLDSVRLEQAAGPVGLRLEGRRSQHYPLTIPKPMIAAINGPCAGIGLIQALVCDVRFMARGAKLSTAYAKLGIPAEYGLSWLLPRMIGVEHALDLLLSARRVDAEEAQRIGLVSRVCDAGDVLAQAQAYAHLLATGSSPRSMAAIRRQVWGDLSRDYTEANELWLRTMVRMNMPDNPDFGEGVSAMVQKRAPRFAPLPDGYELPELPPFVPQ
ncbi:MAG: enoyl-CoA hydratase-related protein [Actinomycetota bacterium]|nr:enoyl-CoA hydratase-related protein [Actinomycetota bacterium]